MGKQESWRGFSEVHCILNRVQEAMSLGEEWKFKQVGKGSEC